MKKHFLLFVFMLPLLALAQQTPSGTESQPVRMEESIPPPPPNWPESPSSDEDKIFVTPEVMPEFPGGRDAMYTYLGKNLQYPADALEAKLQGTVFITFIVNKGWKYFSDNRATRYFPFLG